MGLDVRTLITFGGQHQGIVNFPGCTIDSEGKSPPKVGTTCRVRLSSSKRFVEVTRLCLFVQLRGLATWAFLLGFPPSSLPQLKRACAVCSCLDWVLFTVELINIEHSASIMWGKSLRWHWDFQVFFPQNCGPSGSISRAATISHMPKGPSCILARAIIRLHQ
jgi:hypothetical protein